MVTHTHSHTHTHLHTHTLTHSLTYLLTHSLTHSLTLSLSLSLSLLAGGVDFTPLQDVRLVFNSTTNSITVPITIINDILTENDETFTASIRLVMAEQRVMLAPDEAMVTITDTDRKHTLTHTHTLTRSHSHTHSLSLRCCYWLHVTNILSCRGDRSYRGNG